MPVSRRGYRELLVLFGLLAFGSSVTGSFWVVYLFRVAGLPPAAIAALLGAAALTAVVVAMVMTRPKSLPATPAMVAGLASLAGAQLALAFVQGPAQLGLFALLYGAYIPLFFLPWNTLLASETRVHDRGAKLAGINLTNSIATAGAPFVGGVIASAWGFPVLFALGAALLVLAAGIAVALGQISVPVRLMWAPRRLGRGTVTAFAAQGGIDGVLWSAIPLATVSFVQGEVQLGALFSLFAVSGGVFSVVLGRWSDRIRHRRRFIALGAAVSVPLAVGVGVAPGLAGFAAATGALNATLVIAPTFVNAAVVDRLEMDIGLVMQTREVVLNLARGISSGAILTLFLAGIPPQLVVLLIAGLLPLQLVAERFP